jgi:hypothetical protein
MEKTLKHRTTKSPFLSNLRAAESFASLSADNILESISSMVRTNTSGSAKAAWGGKRIAVITNKEIHFTKELFALVCCVVIGLPLFVGLSATRCRFSRQKKPGRKYRRDISATRLSQGDPLSFPSHSCEWFSIIVYQLFNCDFVKAHSMPKPPETTGTLL